LRPLFVSKNLLHNNNNNNNDDDDDDDNNNNNNKLFIEHGVVLKKTEYDGRKNTAGRTIP